MTPKKNNLHLLSWTRIHFKVLFFLFFACMFFNGMLTVRDNYLVTTLHAPKGILNWETNTDNALRDSMIREWSMRYKNVLSYHNGTGNQDGPVLTRVTGLQTVLAQNQADYVFIFFYTGTLLLYIFRLRMITRFGPGWLPGVLNALVILAAILDVIEDLGTSRILHAVLDHRSLPDAGTIGYPSLLKWLMLALVGGVLLWQSIRLKLAVHWLAILSGALNAGAGLVWRFRAVLLTLLAVFLVCYISDQGQDLLMTINASKWGVVWFLVTISILSLLCWHLPKVVDNGTRLSFAQFWVGKVRFVATTRSMEKNKLDFGRLLGAAGFLIPATGIIKTMDNYHMDYWLSGIPSLGMLFALLLLYAAALRYGWIERVYLDRRALIRWPRLVWTLAMLCIPVVLWGWAYDSQQQEPYFIIYLALDLVILSVVFLILATLRRHFSAIGEWPVAPWITFGGLACLILFIACNWPAILHPFIDHSRFYTMPFVFCAVSGYLLLFSFLLFTGRKTGVYWVTLLLVFTFYRAATGVTNYHRIAIRTDHGYHKGLDSLDHYAERWLLDREAEIAAYPGRNGGKPYPVFLVNAHGGGIRAAVWTTMVTGALDQELRKDTAADKRLGFQHFVFAYSGASGGTVGAMLLCGARYSHLRKLAVDTVLYPGNSTRLYQTDNLSSTIIALLGRDVLLPLTGYFSGIDDRARLMERDWEKNAADQGIWIREKMGGIWNTGGTEVPLLFSNTYDVNTGNKGIVAPVLLDSLDFPSVLFLEQMIPDPGDLRLSTAAFLSARFPYVSPTGKLNGQHHFTDGGTIENSAAETALQVTDVLERVRKKLLQQHPAFLNIRIQLLSLPNEVPEVVSPVYDQGFYEPMAPPAGILKLREANGERAELISRFRASSLGYGYIQFQPRPYRTAGKAVWPVLPLGWQISDLALESLRHSALRYPSELDTVLQVFGLTRKKGPGSTTKYTGPGF